VPVVQTSSGRLEGRETERGFAFLGVPFAAAPRWAPPTAPPGWAGVRDATSPGPAAPQPERAVATFTHGELPPTAEECLNLNVFTPSLTGSRPVLVWIHGGGFAIGRGSASLYDGALLAQSAELVVVTINYRLGSLGWLGHPDLAREAGGAIANWGLLDQIAALRWVRENIVGFGGDPTRVTLAGQSAGALCTADLLVAPGARGLFQRALLATPPFGDVAQPADVAQRWAQALAGAVGISAGFDAAQMRAVQPQRLVLTHEALLDDPAWRGSRGGAMPTLDPATLPNSPLDDQGASPDVDVLVGHTAQEGTFFFRSPWRPPPPAERIPGIVGHLFHTDRPQDVLAEYAARAAARAAPTDDLSLLVELATDAMVAQPLAGWAAARAQGVDGRSRVYRYRVDHPGAGPELGATHTVETPLFFGTWGDGGPGQRLAGQAPGSGAVAEQLRTDWACFIHDGDPGWAPLTDQQPENIKVFGIAA
jgi:para-nitrobenzyl esterase